MNGVSAEVRVKAVEPHRRILIEWEDPPLPVAVHFPGGLNDPRNYLQLGF